MNAPKLEVLEKPCDGQLRYNEIVKRQMANCKHWQRTNLHMDYLMHRHEGELPSQFRKRWEMK